MKITRALQLFVLIALGCVCSFAQTKDKERVVEIPFDFYHNEIILQVNVNGKGPFNMMLDTGTDPSAVDLATAKDLGLKLDPVGQQASGGGTSVTLAYATKLPLVEVGGLTVKNLEAAAIDLNRISERLGKPIHGVLGHSLLNRRIVQIDYPHHVVRFLSEPPSSKAVNQSSSPNYTALTFRYADNVLIDGVYVNGKKMVANLDSGSDGTFQLTPAAVSALGLEEDVSKAQVKTSVGYRGISENREGKIRNVTLGGISVEAPTVLFFAKGSGRDKEPWGINIGNAFLKDFVVTIDYRKKLVTLERP